MGKKKRQATTATMVAVESPASGVANPLRSWIGALAVVVMTFVSYSSVFDAGYVWDDDDYVTKNATLRSADGLRRIWFEPGAVPQYYPLTHTSYWIEYRLWGLEPRGYHLTNIALHAGNAVLVGQVLTALAVPGAWAAAALFAVHPVHVESVAWITERKNTLSGFFYLLALLAFVRFRLTPNPSTARGSNTLYYWSLALFVAALLSKTVTATLPVALLILQWWRRGRLAGQDLRLVAPMVVLGVALSAVTVWMEQNLVGASGPEWALSFADRCLIASRAVWFYLGKLVWPSPLIFFYPRWTIDATQPLQYVPLLAAAVVALVFYFQRQRLGRAPLAAALYFVATLGPALGFVNTYPMLYSFVADHFQYLASLGPLCLTAALGARQLRRLHPYAGHVALALACLVLGSLSWQQGLAYKDLRTLWRDTLAKNRSAWMVHNNLGLMLLDDGQAELAGRSFESALRIKPNDAFAHNNLGLSMMRMGDEEGALRQFQKAAELDPRYAEARINLGNLLAQQGQFDAAGEQFLRAAQIAPRSAEALGNLANVRMLQQRSSDAEVLYERAIAIDPDFADALHNLGILRAQQGRLGDAERLYRRAIELNPQGADAHLHLGYVLAAQARVAEARTAFEEARRLRPGNAAATKALEALDSP